MVWVRNADGVYLPGIVASKPPHYMSEQEKKAPLEIRQITVDVGATSREDAIKSFRIRIGEPVVPCVAFEYSMDNDQMFGKAFDDRLGCAAILSTLQELKGESLKVDAVAAFACQEEVGARGCVVTSRVVKPDIAIVFEGCPADDTCVDSYEIQTAIKKGPMLRHIDAKMITNPRFQRFALDLAAKNNIAVQEAVRSGGSTNGAFIHLSNEGVPTIVIGIPVRYAHTHYGISTYYDYENGVKLACAVLKELNEDIIKSF
jgi:putative aminopeptidase FrvX